MIISDLSILEVVEANELVGAGKKKYYSYDPRYAFADADSNAYAKGKNFAATYTSTVTSAKTDRYGATASSDSSSKSVAH